MPGAFQVSLQTKAKSTDKAISEVLREIHAIRAKEVSDQELADAKSYLIGSFPLRLDTTGKLATLLTLIEFYGLGPNYFTDFPKNLSLVTKEDVLRVAKQYLHPDHYVLVIVGKASSAQTTPSKLQSEN
jgi:zinc protease